MNAVIYLLMAGLAAVLAGRAWARDRRDPLNRDFALMAVLCATTYTCFSLFLFPGLTWARFPFAVAGTFLPVATLQFLEHFFATEDSEPTPLLRRLWVVTPFVAMGYLAVRLVLYGNDWGAGPPEIVLGTLVFGGFAATFYQLWQRHQSTPYRVEKARMRYLLGFMAGSVVFWALEGSDRIFNEVPITEAMGAIERSVALQGSLPPVGALFTGLFLFFLYQVLSMERLLDLNEIFARVVTVAATAAALVFFIGVAVLWVQTAANSRVQATFHLFVVSVLFLLAYDPIRHRIQAQAAVLFNIRGHQLALALDEVDTALSKIITVEQLAQVLLDRLHASGRIPELSLYLFDPARDQMRLIRSRGAQHPLAAVAPKPFADGFEAGARAYVRQDLQRLRLHGIQVDDADARLRLMEGMQSDLVVPLKSGDAVLGWLALRDEDWSDGFSQEEVGRLCATMSRAAVVVENVKGFERVKEQSRLAALGTMSAGLAHEIRNPLAGIKGAAQYLQTLETNEEGLEFLQVITTETDRLNGVVTSFLNYARQLEVDAQPTSLNELVQQVLAVIGAEGVPEEVDLAADLADNLPLIPVDGGKIQQVLHNLIRNAFQALPEGGRVVVSTSRGHLPGKRGPEGRALEITVADDGDGVAVEDQEKLFIPFYTTKTGGTGLGLPICQRIVEAHGGELSLQSAAGAGAAFTLRLPMPIPPAPVEAEAEAEA